MRPFFYSTWQNFFFNYSNRFVKLVCNIMNNIQYSIIIPVFNRPDEVEELLQSLSESTFNAPFEVIIVEDGSTISCESVVTKFIKFLDISYYFKANSGPGASRNFGMERAKGNYFIIFDSDCIIPNQYLTEVDIELQTDYCHCFGGADRALDSFSNVQKAINFAMTSFLTTGGVRGGSEKLNKFQPRSFNMGLSKEAFDLSKGFGIIHPGEDPDLTMRLWNLGLDTRLFPKAYVYHKRRIDWGKFSLQVSKFGMVRPILNSWFPKYNKLTYFFPTLFILGFYFSLLLMLFGIFWGASIYLLYFLIIFLFATAETKSITIGLYSVFAVFKQMQGYGLGFLNSYWKIIILKKNPEDTFPKLFF